MGEDQIMQVLQRVADRNGVSLTTVLKEIDRVIDGGMDSPNPQIRVRWKRIPCKGAKPTAVKLMAYLMDRMMDQAFLV